MNIESIVAIVFGVVFLITLTIISLVVKKPTPFQLTVFRVILALAAAGVATTLPGFLNVNLEPGANFLVRAGGALAVFVIVYFFNPMAVPECVRLSMKDRALIFRHVDLISGRIHGYGSDHLPKALRAPLADLRELYEKLV